MELTDFSLSIDAEASAVTLEIQGALALRAPLSIFENTPLPEVMRRLRDAYEICGMQM